MKKINKVRLLINSLLFIVLPILLNVVIESLGHKTLFGGIEMLFNKPVVFLCNALIIACTLSVGILLRRFRYFWIVAVSLLWILLGVSNFLLLCNRVLPLTAHDMQLLDILSSMMHKYLNPFFLAVVALAIVALLIGIFILLFRSRSPKGKISFIKPVAFLLIMVSVTFGSLKIAVATGALQTRFPELPKAYLENGFAYSFSLSLLDTGIDRVDGYSEDLIDSIVDNFEKTDKDEVETPNIIFLQLESFFDVNCLKSVELSENPLPNFTSLTAENPSGLITVPTIGAGTVNTELEIVTGMRMSDFGAGEYPYKTILKENTCESIANNLKNHGYSSHFIHNYKGTFYGRHLVYANLGYDYYCGIEQMDKYTLTENGWPEDKILTKYIQERLEYTKGPDVITCISVQPHGSYSDVGKYEKHVTVTACDNESLRESYEYYVNQLYEVDQFIGELIEFLSKKSEDTILVAYGDHFPSLEFKDSELDGRTIYQTDYFIWNNMGLEFEDKDMPAYQLNSTVLESINVKDGVINSCHQTYKDSEQYEYYLTALEYDILYGKKYAYDGKDPYTVSKLNSQTLQQALRITDVLEKDAEKGLYVVLGNGFSKDTLVRVNGMIVPTEYLNSYTLQFKWKKYKPGQKVCVWELEYGNSENFIADPKDTEDQKDSSILD